MTSEFDLIARLSGQLAATGGELWVGAGDDAAVLAVGGTGMAVTTDVVVQDVHFLRAISSLEDIGWKALAVNVSDLAAMGARPTAAVIGLSCPADLTLDEVEAIYAGLRQAADRWGVRLVGGDTVRAPTLSLAVTALGEVAQGRAVTRGGARPGDELVVVGALGAAAAGLAQAQADATGDRALDPALLAAHLRPTALPDAGRVLAQAGATAMIDVSDGLTADLGHVLTASGVGAVVGRDQLPVAAGVVAAARDQGLDPWSLVCAGGEDFALLAALPAEAAASAARSATAAEGVPAAVVGRIVAGGGLVLLDPDGEPVDDVYGGFDHFRNDGPPSQGRGAHP